MEHGPSKGRGENTESQTFWGRAINIGIFVVIIFLLVFVFYISLNNTGTDLATINTTITPSRVVSSQSVSTLPVSAPVIKPSVTSRNTLSPTQQPTTVLVSNSQESYSAQISCDDISKVNLRNTPGYVSKDDSKDVVFEIPCGEFLDLLKRTKYVDNLTWWKVEWNNYEGWVSDHTGSDKLILVFNKPSFFSKSDPAEFLFWYFNAVWRERDYDFLWNNFMTASFQNHSGSGSVESYVDWGNRIERIDVNSIEILENNDDYAWVRIQLTFYLNDRKSPSNGSYDYTLIFDATRKIWVFDYR